MNTRHQVEGPVMQKLFVIIARDNPAAGNARSLHRDGHLQHFQKIASSIAVAGPLFDDDGASAGSLIIVKADDASAAEALIKDDPFYTNGVWIDLETKGFKASSGDWA